MAGPDGRWYFNQGNCGALITDKDGRTFRLGGVYYNQGAGNPIWFNNPTEYAGRPSDDGKVWLSGAIGRMNPDGSGVQIVGHGFRNSFEHCLSSFGDLYQNDNDDQGSCRNAWVMEGGFLGYFSRDGQRTWDADKRPGQTVPVAHWRQEDPGTLPPGDIYGAGSPTGIAFYENGALPKKYAGSLFSAEARQRVIFSYQPKLGRGAAVELGARSELLASRKNFLFRPSDVMVGADGALYVADWFDNRVGGHADNDESMSGTIYRIAPRGFKPAVPKPTGDAIADAVNRLKSPAANVRFAGFTVLKAAGGKALPAVQGVLADPDRWISARAVWLLPLLGEKGAALCRERLHHPDAEQRLLAFRALRNAGADILTLARELVTDPSPAVRREIAIPLRDLDGAKKRDFVVRLFAQLTDADDRTCLEACGTAALGSEADVWAELAQTQADALKWSPAFARITWRLLPPAAVPALIQRTRAAALTATERRLAFDTLAFIGNREGLVALQSRPRSLEGVRHPRNPPAARHLRSGENRASIHRRPAGRAEDLPAPARRRNRQTRGRCRAGKNPGRPLHHVPPDRRQRRRVRARSHRLGQGSGRGGVHHCGRFSFAGHRARLRAHPRGAEGGRPDRRHRPEHQRSRDDRVDGRRHAAHPSGKNPADEGQPFQVADVLRRATRPHRPGPCRSRSVSENPLASPR
jgi:putative membrane-bound dehydrogenase-like protein